VEFAIDRAQFLLTACHGTAEPRRMDAPAEAEIVDPVGTHGVDSLAGEVRLRPAADPVGVGRLCRGGPRDRGWCTSARRTRPGDGHRREQVTAVWPPTGIGPRAALSGTPLLPGSLLGAFSPMRRRASRSDGLRHGPRQTAEAMVGGWLLRRAASPPRSGRLRDVLHSCPRGVRQHDRERTTGVLSLCAEAVQPGRCRMLWPVWWIGDRWGPS